MKKKQHKKRLDTGISLFFSILLIFCILGAVVFSVAKKTSSEMSASAIQNLSESLDLMKGTLEAILRNEAEFQKLMAQELALTEDPEKFIQSCQKNKAMSKVSLLPSGKTEGISSTGEPFLEEELNFSAGGTVDGLPISESYVNYMGTWAYTMKCPVVSDGKEIASLYVEYIYDSFEESLPNGFYDGKAMLYIMDAQSERMVLKPKGMGERNAGHLNLEDFYRANNIREEDLLAEVSDCVKNGKHILFYHDIQKKESLNYMWSVNGGTVYLIGYVPVEAIQQEGRSVNQNIFIVVMVMLIAFFLCCILYYFNQKQQNKVRKEREEEREIHNQRLSEALQAAQIASQSKTTFLSNMSHDIRTPMNAVLGFTTLLARDAENPSKVREYTKKITASGQHLLSLINDILDVSKIESGKVVLSVEEFTLNDMVSSVDAIIRPMAKAKKQAFTIEIKGVQHEYLLGDEMRINQILINLLSNAVKYTPECGSIWFRIIGEGQHSNQCERVRIEVEDNGYGMTKEYLETIFEAFTRAENSTTNKIQGTGLGMAITKNIVELMGGTIEVFSELNQGSLFRVALEFPISESQSARKFWADQGIVSILAVTDDEETTHTVQDRMKTVGVQADVAHEMSMALQMLKRSFDASNGYQAILVSQNLLKKDQARLEEILQNRPDSVPVVILAEPDLDDADTAAQTAFTGILHEPFFVSAFQEKLLEIQAEQNGKQNGMQEGGNLDGLRFLAAEDNDINAEILSEVLSIEGASCELAENGKLALERFENAKEGEFDAILMDVQMPVMNGYEATRAIRALERKDAKTIPIIAMTANAFSEDQKEALDAGMNVHVAKPIDIDLLKKAIMECIQRRE